MQLSLNEAQSQLHDTQEALDILNANIQVHDGFSPRSRADGERMFIIVRDLNDQAARCVTTKTLLERRIAQLT